jgi:hypothetical protein
VSDESYFNCCFLQVDYTFTFEWLICYAQYNIQRDYFIYACTPLLYDIHECKG